VKGGLLHANPKLSLGDALKMTWTNFKYPVASYTMTSKQSVFVIIT